MQEEYVDIKLGVLLPFLKQEESWNEVNRAYYESILARADFVDAIFKRPYEGPQQLRIKNEYMIQKSNAILIIYDVEKEGSPKFAYFAALKRHEQEEYPILVISLDDLQQAAEESEWTD